MNCSTALLVIAIASAGYGVWAASVVTPMLAMTSFAALVPVEGLCLSPVTSSYS
jgi:hypothetical protein